MRALMLLALFPAAAAAESGFTFGVEATALFSQELKPKPNPNVTRVRTDNLTSVTLTRSEDYFKENQAINGTSTTYTRTWDKIDTSANYLFVKGSYSTEFFEAIIKLGSADRRITRKEKTQSRTIPPGGASQTDETVIVTSNLVDLPQGFAYGFQLRGSPYQTENFSVLAGIHFHSSVIKGQRIETSTVRTTTAGIAISDVSQLDLVDFDQYEYGLTLGVSANLLAVQPFLGLAYSDGKLKGKQKTATLTQGYNSAGSVTSSITTIDTLEYTFLPTKKIAFVAGISFPFERGSVTLEGRLQGQSSIGINAVLGF